jgi:hypothetical protein
LFSRAAVPTLVPPNLWTVHVEDAILVFIYRLL